MPAIHSRLDIYKTACGRSLRQVTTGEPATCRQCLKYIEAHFSKPIKLDFTMATSWMKIEDYTGPHAELVRERQRQYDAAISTD